MNTTLRKGLTVMVTGAALLTGCLVSAVPASAKTTNRTQKMLYAYDKSGKVYYGTVNYATNEVKKGNRHIYNVNLSTDSKKSQVVEWGIYCGSSLKFAAADGFKGSSTLDIDADFYCSVPVTVEYETTEGAHRSETLLY
jgi:hypothetical protein